jgi:hypothetical protein
MPHEERPSIRLQYRQGLVQQAAGTVEGEHGGLCARACVCVGGCRLQRAPAGKLHGVQVSLSEERVGQLVAKSGLSPMH